MSNSTERPGTGHMTIFAGATFREPWARATIPYETQEINGVICKMDGTPVPDSDIQPDNYTGCTAVMELRDADSDALLATFTTDDGTITFQASDPTVVGLLDSIQLYMGATATGALTAFTAAVGQVEVRRPWGDIERQYEFTFDYSKQSTAVEPPVITP